MLSVNLNNMSESVAVRVFKLLDKTTGRDRVCRSDLRENVFMHQNNYYDEDAVIKLINE